MGSPIHSKDLRASNLANPGVLPEPGLLRAGTRAVDLSVGKHRPRAFAKVFSDYCWGVRLDLVDELSKRLTAPQASERRSFEEVGARAQELSLARLVVEQALGALNALWEIERKLNAFSASRVLEKIEARECAKRAVVKNVRP